MSRVGRVAADMSERLVEHGLGIFLTVALIVIGVMTAIVMGEAPPSPPPPPVELHYAPGEDLAAIDGALIDGAETAIDMAAYRLDDEAVISALRDAAARGVVVRIYRNRDEASYVPSAAYAALRATPGVAIRIKRAYALMHLKSYAIDGKLLRTGAANFTLSGETRQDNDLVVIRDPAAAARFEADFARMWDEGEPER